MQFSNTMFMGETIALPINIVFGDEVYKMTWNALKNTMDKIFKTKFWNKIKKERVYALLSHDGELERTYLTINGQ